MGISRETASRAEETASPRAGPHLEFWKNEVGAGRPLWPRRGDGGGEGREGTGIAGEAASGRTCAFTLREVGALEGCGQSGGKI